MGWQVTRFKAAILSIISEIKGWHYYLPVAYMCAGSYEGMPDIIMTDSKEVVFAYVIEDRTQLDDAKRGWMRALMQCKYCELRLLDMKHNDDNNVSDRDIGKMIKENTYSVSRSIFENATHVVYTRIRAMDAIQFPPMMLVEPPAVVFVIPVALHTKYNIWYNAAKTHAAVSLMVWQPRDLNNIRRKFGLSIKKRG